MIVFHVFILLGKHSYLFLNAHVTIEENLTLHETCNMTAQSKREGALRMHSSVHAVSQHHNIDFAFHTHPGGHSLKIGDGGAWTN